MGREGEEEEEEEKSKENINPKKMLPQRNKKEHIKL